MPSLPKTLAFIDIETTGASLSNDRVIDIGIIRVENGKVVKTYNKLIDPDCFLPPGITRLTGITQADLESAPTFTQVQDEILEILKGAVFVAHNVDFDYRFLKNEFKRRGINFSEKRLCTVRLSRFLYPQFSRHNLDSIIERHEIKIVDRHRGFGDAQAIYEFYQRILSLHPLEELVKIINLLLKKPNTPIAIDPLLISALPESPGVYIMYGKGNSQEQNSIPLYIGKSKNIKKRVASHFSSSNFSATGLKLATQTNFIETIKAAGELEALLKESVLIKKLQPLYNKRLRHSRQIVALTIEDLPNTYMHVKTEVLDYIDPLQIKNILGIFRSVIQAKEYLTKKCEEFELCDKLLNLEKTNRGCFGHILGRCKGACVGKESFLKYNMRLTQAFSGKRFKPWPFQGAIFIKENDEDKQTIHVVDKWCYLGTVDSLASDVITKLDNLQFDIDIYKILYSFIMSPKNSRYIKPINFQFQQSQNSFRV